MPPATITADADLEWHRRADRCAASRRAARGSTITGRAPLDAAGALNLRAGGTLDLALLDPILAAGGRRVRGQVTLDATVTGTVAAPNVAGSARLAGGEVQDFAVGLHLSDIAARVEGSGATLRIAQFSAKAGQGTIGASGSIGVMAPGMPVDLTITARNAQPLASDLITATLDADLTLRGEALGQLAVGGSVHVRRADMRVPERMPAAIAVLPVSQPGAKPAPPPTSVSVDRAEHRAGAPQQIFVRGRGLDVEFGGAMKMGGTTAAPRTEGGLELRRGCDQPGRTIAGFHRGPHQLQRRQHHRSGAAPGRQQHQRQRHRDADHRRHRARIRRSRCPACRRCRRTRCWRNCCSAAASASSARWRWRGSPPAWRR